MKNTITLLLISASFLSTHAQTDVDAFRYSRLSITGTGRFTGMSGAFGALGGDFTSLSYNPAGIAIYRSSEFLFTPSIYVGKTVSTFLGQEFDERKYNFNFGNVGLVYTRKLSESSSPGWKSWNFGLGYNRLANFHNRNYYEGLNRQNSLVDHFAEQAHGLNPSNLDPFFEGLAYETYLITPDNKSSRSAAPSPGAPSVKPYSHSEPTIPTGFISARRLASKVCASWKMPPMKSSIRTPWWIISIA
jgi:hypothetical protein